MKQIYHRFLFKNQVSELINLDKKIISETRKWIVLIIRNYEPKDLEEIIRLFKKTIFEINIADYDLAQVEAWSKVDKLSFNDNLLATKSRLVVNQDEVVGFGNIDDRGYIDLFYISADYQRQGVGQQLLKDLEKSSQALMFSVNSSITAKAFFEKMGYQELKQNLVYLRGQEFINYTLLKKAK